jgi:hypothetical protein
MNGLICHFLSDAAALISRWDDLAPLLSALSLRIAVLRSPHSSQA